MKLATETRTPSEGRAGFEKFHSKLGISLLSEQGQASDLPPQEPPSPPEIDRNAVEVAGTANFAMIVEGDLHLHEHYHNHLHLEDQPAETPPTPNRLEKMPQPIEVEVQWPRLDPRCERLCEHLERVKEWKARMGR